MLKKIYYFLFEFRVSRKTIETFNPFFMLLIHFYIFYLLLKILSKLFELLS